MTLPNWLTLSRLLLTIPFLACLEVRGLEFWALGIFVFASATDWLDGYLARKLNQVSELGKLLDPLVDKVLVTGAIVALASKGVVPAWSVTAILFREFLVTGLRAVEASRGVIIAAGMLGKIKTVLQMVAIGFLLYALNPAGSGVVPGTMATIGIVVYWAAVVMTMLSGAQYLWDGRELLVDAPQDTTSM